MSAPIEGSFGQLLRRFRLATDFTQEDLAAHAGIGVRTIADLERGVSLFPHPHTVEALADALHLTGSSRASFAAAARRPGASASQEQERAVDSSAPVFVGRANELAVGARFLDGDGPSVLLFAGEPGIGKSRLLREVMAQARATGWRVVAGGCDQRSGREPYAPFVETLEESLRATPPSRRKGDLKECDWLSRLGPELAEQIKTPAPEWSLTPEQERRMIFAAVRRYLINIAGPAGTVLVLDDLQWAGLDALDLLAFLVHAPAGAPLQSARGSPSPTLRVLGAYRTSEVHSGHPVEGLLVDLAHDERVSQYELDRLSEGEARALATSLVGGAPDAEQRITKIVTRAEGVPFYLVNFAQAFHQGVDATPSASNLDTHAREPKAPWQVTATIRRRLALLPSEAQDTLALAAIIGRVASLELLRLALHSADDAVAATLETACRAQLLEEASGATVAYQFTHDLIRETTMKSLSKARLLLLHRRVGDALEQTPAGRSRQAAIANHFAQAGDYARALPHQLAAGDQAEAVYAHAEAERHYHTAVDLAHELGDQQREALALEKLGRALGYLSSPTGALDALDALDRAAQTYQALGDAEGELRVLAALAGAHGNHTIERAEAALARILPRLAALGAEVAQTGHPSPGLASATLEVTTLYFTASRLDDALACVERGAQLARAVGDDALLARAYMVRGYTKMLIGSEGSLADFLDAVVLAERTDSEFLAMGLNFVTSTYLSEGQLALAKPYAERALAVAERRQVPEHIAFMHTSLGELALYRGDWDEAREHFAHAAALQERLDPTYTWGDGAPMQVSLCLLDLAQGRAIEESIRRLESLLGIMRELVNHPALDTGALGEVALAERHLLMDHAADARARLTAFLDQPALAEHARMAGARMNASPTLAWAEAELGHDAEAAERLEVAIAMATARRERRWLADALRVKGLLAARQRRWDDARAALDEAIALCRAMPYPYAEAKALYVYGQLESARGNPVAARERFEQALVICDRLGEGLYRRHIARTVSALSIG